MTFNSQMNFYTSVELTELTKEYLKEKDELIITIKIPNISKYNIGTGKLYFHNALDIKEIQELINKTE